MMLWDDWKLKNVFENRSHGIISSEFLIECRLIPKSKTVESFETERKNYSMQKES